MTWLDSRSMTRVYGMSIKKQIDLLSRHQAGFDIFTLLAVSATAARTVLARRCEPLCGGNFSDTIIVHVV